ncbi:MAG: nitroreductase [Pseudobdellovibrionaceae bacterium]|jgi:nitroreductase|nr:nitroreductase [Pseudobdellovibrionaceae bacterium]
MSELSVVDFLKRRRSTKVATLQDPGPNSSQIQEILEIGTRVPDHGKYCPWYFIVLQGEARRKAGDLLRQAYKAENPDAAEAKLDLEAEKFLRAPLIIVVVSRIREGKHPQWEQILSAGAVCYNICLAANALGFGTNWLSEWYSFSPTFKLLMGVDEQDHFAGFLYIGTQSEKNEERERPDLSNLVTYWDGSSPLKTGETYGIPGSGYPVSCWSPKS